MVMCRRPCGGGPCDYCVSPSPFGLDFGTLDLGLTINALDNFVPNGQTDRRTDRGTARAPVGAKNISSC